MVRILSKTPLTNLASLPVGKKALAISMNSFTTALGGVFLISSSDVAALNRARRVGSIRFNGHESFND